MLTTIGQKSFSPADLKIGERQPGISAFMRIRNGADFVEPTIRSHIGFFDEIIAVYNQCTDDTPAILGRLAQEYAGRLKVYHYTDRVFPPGSSDHASTPPTSPSSLVNYSNTALALTTRQVVTKLDDDHLAMNQAVARTVADIRAGRTRDDEMQSFSGLNLVRASASSLAIPARDPVSGNGDIGFFRISEETLFVHDRRFERFRRGRLKRRFAGFLYWHLKYLKSGMGFANYELEANPESRFVERKETFTSGKLETWDLPRYIEIAGRKSPFARMAALFSDKARFILDRDKALAPTFGAMTLDQALAATTDPEMLAMALADRT